MSGPASGAGRLDALVCGAGPAGLSAAAALASHGLSVACLALKHDRPWTPTYGAWADEVDGTPAAGAVANRWDRVTVTGGRDVGRAYVQLDNAALQSVLRSAPGVRELRGLAAAVEHDDTGATVTCRDGSSVRATVVVDCTGPRPALVEPAGGGTAVQAAYGVVASFDRPPAVPGSAVLMDWSSVEPAGDPTFLYALDLGDGRWLAEETSLARRPPLPYPELERRLHTRLSRKGTPAGEVHAVERVHIVMDAPLPRLGQPTLALGAAASMVHPATGYSVAASLRAAPELAAAVASALSQPGGGPARAAAYGWAMIWPTERVRTRALHAFGLEVLLRMDQRQTQQFFATFFRLPPARWHGYLSGRLGPAETAQAMGMLWARAPAAVRRLLAQAALSADGRNALSALVGGVSDPFGSGPSSST